MYTHYRPVRKFGRLALAAVLISASAAVAVGLLAVGAGPAGAAAPNDPFGCATANPVAAPVGLPAGTTFWMHNGFNGTFNSSPPSTIAYGTGSGAQTGVLGVTPSGCVLNGLSYNAADGYLYAFENTEVLTNPCTTSYAAVKIGRDATGAMAIDAVNRITTAVGAAPANNCIGAGDADADPLTNKILVPGSYYAVGTPTSLTSLDNYTSYISSVDPAGGAMTNVKQSFDASCTPYLQNWIGQLRAFDYRLSYLASVPGNDGQVAPEGSFQDWSFNPADGQLYAYVSVDLRQSTYPTQVPPDPTGTLGAPADNTQNYLGAKVAIPAYNWDPAIASPSYTIVTQPDWILRINPTTGATTCAAAGAAARSGAINLPGSTYPNSSAANPVYAPAPNNHTLIAGGGVEIAGSAFSAPNVLEKLFDSENARHYTLNTAGCTFGSATPSCTPTLDSDALPTGRSRGDAAAFTGTPITIDKVATGAGATAFSFTVSSSAQDSSSFTVTDGGSHTAEVNAFADSVNITEATNPDWKFQSAGCDHGTVTTTGSSITLERSIGATGVTAICTFVNVASAELAATGAGGAPQLTLVGLLALITGVALARIGQPRRNAPGR